MEKEYQLARLYEEFKDTPSLQRVAAGRDPERGQGPLITPVVVVTETPLDVPDYQLLRKLFRKAGLPWELCYITSVLPWNPAGDRGLYPYEVIASRARLEQEIDIIAPEYVILFGDAPWDAVSEGDYGLLVEARGQLFQVAWKDWLMLPVYAPHEILSARKAEQAAREQATVTALKSLLKEDASAS